MEKILYKDNTYIESGYMGTSIIYKDASGFVKNDIYIEDNNEAEIKSSARILSVQQAAEIIANPFINYPDDCCGSQRGYSQIDEGIEALWRSIEKVYISTMRAVEKNLPMHCRDTKRYIIFQSMVWFFRCKYSYQELWGMELIEELIRICVYEIRTVIYDDYEPEDCYPDNNQDSDTDSNTVLDSMEGEAKSQDDYEPENYYTDNGTVLDGMESEENYPNIDYQICEMRRENEQPF